jgi:hypothetical protein
MDVPHTTAFLCRPRMVAAEEPTDEKNRPLMEEGGEDRGEDSIEWT